MAVPGFERRQAPLAARVAAGVFVDCIFAPLMWGTQKLGVAEKMLASVSDKREQEFIKKNPFRGYVPGAQDVFVMTYAKSGTNWMMQIVWQLIHHGKGEFDHIHNVVPWPDAKLVGGPMMGNYAIPLDQATDWETAPERKRVIKTHFNWELLPYSEEARYIAVIRDPKDVFVSSYFFMKGSGMGGAMPSVDTMYRLFLADKYMLGGSWPANTAGYWAQRHKANVLVVSFKSMKRDLEGTVRRVAGFLNVCAPDDVIREVCAKASFPYMKRIDHKFGTFQVIPWRAPSVMMRKGDQGASGELLTPERQREMDAHCIAELKRLGSDFPYEEFCDPAS
jgi:Sulfotransferase domain